MKKRPEESISDILSKAPTVQKTYPGIQGFVLMVLAILASKRRWPWVLVATLSGGTAKYIGWI